MPVVDSTLMLAGTFGNVSLDDLFTVVSLSRQTVEIVLDDDPDGRRGIVLQAGRVLDATAPPDVGREAFHRLYRAPGRAFEVWKRPRRDTMPIGSLSELVAESQRAIAPGESPDARILAGSLSDYRISDVLDVLAITRQRVELTTRRADGSSTKMVLKAERLVMCEDTRGALSGSQAFFAVYADPGESFEVTRVADGETSPKALALVSTLVQQARFRRPTVSAREVILEGTFAATPLADVLASLTLSRLPLEMVLSGDHGVRGTILLKSGQVLLAEVLEGGLSGRDAFFHLIDAPGERFVVARRPGAADFPVGKPCGVLRELLLAAKAPSRTTTAPHASLKKARPPEVRRPVPKPKPRPKRPRSAPVVPIVGRSPRVRIPEVPANDVVLDGTFETFSVDEVLCVAAISRQYICVTTTRGATPVARLVVKSGQVLAVSHGTERDPVRAIGLLLDAPGDRFRVQRMPRQTGRSIGALVSLRRAAEQARESDAASPLRLVKVEVETEDEDPSTMGASPETMGVETPGRKALSREAEPIGTPSAENPPGTQGTSSDITAAVVTQTAPLLQALDASIRALATTLADTRAPPVTINVPGQAVLWALAVGQTLIAAALATALLSN